MRPAKHLAFIALTVSSLSLAACGREQPPADNGKPADAAASAKAENLSESSRQLLSWLPDSAAVPGWTRTSDPKRYGADNLWEYINGAAETFVTHGFQEAATAGYADASHKLEATIDIYKMEGATGAYGMYAEELNPSATFVNIGAEGYRSGNTLNFWAGPAYVKLTSPEEGPEVAAALETLAAEVARRIGPAGDRPPVFDRFPKPNLVPHSFKVLPKDVLAQSYLANGYQAEYKDGRASWKLVLIDAGDEASATASLDRYRAFVGGAAPARAIKAPGQGGFAGKDSYYGLIVAVRSGNHIGVAVGAPSERQATAQLAALLGK